MKVRLSKLALSEFEAILTGVRGENPLAAARLERASGAYSSGSPSFPKVFRRSSTGLASGVFPLVRYPHVIHYGIIDGDVIILRIIHGARRDPWAC